jgi:hypothetical protein
MVIVDESIRKQQIHILSLLFEVNNQVDNEYEAQQLINNTMIKLKEENNLNNFNITTYIKDATKIKWKSSRGKRNEFIKLFMNEIERAKGLYDLTRSEVLFLLSLSSYLSWEENLLVDNEGIPLNQKRLCKELDTDRKTVSKNMKSLEQKKCLIRIWDGRDVYYLVNPHLMFKGEKINRSIPKVFFMIGYDVVDEEKNTKK